MNTYAKNYQKQKVVAYWFLFGALCIIIQVLLGGITRITESGLSITEWNPISGALPPMNESDWIVLFERYQQTDQFVYIKNHFGLEEFKTIFFWEWFHRNWARLLGLFFTVPFIYFIVKKYLTKQQIYQCIILVLMGAIQGLMGWLMVRSGLKKGNLFVDHTFLTIHFILALITLALCLWFALQILIPQGNIIYNNKLRSFQKNFLILIIIQVIYGAFMAGLHAAVYAPTWPTINGEWIPIERMFQFCPPIYNFIYSKIMVHFIHRGLAYAIFIITLVWFFKTAKHTLKHFNMLRYILLGLIAIQILLGILTVIFSADYILMRWLAIGHQFIGMIIFVELIMVNFIVRKIK